MFLKWNLPGIIWAFFIGYLCSLPGDEIPEVAFLPEGFDKAVHFGLFFILAILMSRGFKNQNNYLVLKKYALPIILLFCIFYGGVIEWFQGNFLIGRAADVYDWIADTVGAGFGMVFFNKIIDGK